MKSIFVDDNPKAVSQIPS